MSEQIKELVGRYAANYIQDGMTVGLGTGSTAYYFIDEVGKRVADGRLKNITTVATSKRSEEQARKLGLNIVDIDRVIRLDVVVDGADETTLGDFAGIKGGGGALLREKIVAQNSERSIWIVGQDKIVESLGAFPLPVEVVQFGSFNLFRHFEKAGMNPTFRKVDNDRLFITDSDNYIIDLHLDHIPNPYQLSHELGSTVGVVEHGLFLNYTDTVLVGTPEGDILVYSKGSKTPIRVEVTNNEND